MQGLVTSQPKEHRYLEFQRGEKKSLTNCAIYVMSELKVTVVIGLDLLIGVRAYTDIVNNILQSRSQVVC